MILDTVSEWKQIWQLGKNQERPPSPQVKFSLNGTLVTAAVSVWTDVQTSLNGSDWTALSHSLLFCLDGTLDTTNFKTGAGSARITEWWLQVSLVA